MSAIATNEGPILAQAAVPNAPFLQTVDEKRMGHGSVDTSHLPSDSSLGEDDVSEIDLKTLRRVSGKIPWTAFSIAFVELCERFSYYGTTVVCAYSTPYH